MSDTSEFYSGHENDDDDHQYTDEDQDQEAEWSDEDSDEESDDHGSQDDCLQEQQGAANTSMLKLCLHHNRGEMTKTCKSCSAAFALIKDKKIIAELCGNTDSSELLSRYSGKCDAIETTLYLASDTIRLAQNVFTRGVLRDKKVWTDIVKKHLTLPPDQHEELNLDIQSEDILKKFKSEKRFQHLFSYQRDLAESLRNLRIGQRPLFAVIEMTNIDIGKLRSIAERAGFNFPDLAPAKVGVNIPRNGNMVPDKLKYVDVNNVLPIPDISVFVQENNLDRDVSDGLAELFKSYRELVVSIFVEIYNLFSNYINSSEDYLQFYTQIYSHCDATIRNLIRNKAASLFKEHVKLDILELSSQKKMKEEKPTGLLGGQLLTLFSLIINIL